MTPGQFVAKWTGVTLKERSSAQEHFLGSTNPRLPRPTRSALGTASRKAPRRPVAAIVWKRACYGWEYKGPGKDLQKQNPILKPLDTIR
ncbi:hypothetical protein [uncultured Thiocystis sp.]|jgi:hypothetical protein|uniref:hypothetical protein n=1 Tax=uncultured Thiocystis sp. TaxID=1202134 RepID=UPI0025FD6912|nr:hypothetical protein [uncultured Thiocystis sp.]